MSTDEIIEEFENEVHEDAYFYVSCAWCFGYGAIIPHVSPPCERCSGTGNVKTPSSTFVGWLLGALLESRTRLESRLTSERAKREKLEEENEKLRDDIVEIEDTVRAFFINEGKPHTGEQVVEIHQEVKRICDRWTNSARLE